MLKSELLEIIANGESSGVEFKRDDIRPEQLAKEIVAMANLYGGRVLLGVEDDGTISGIKRTDLELWVMNVIQTKIHPIMVPYYEEVAVDGGLKVAVITFPQGPSKPYALRHQGREDIYIRLGSTSRLATREQQGRLYQLGGILHTEAMAVPGTGSDSLDEARLLNYLKDVLKDPDIPTTPQAWQDRLLALGFLTETAGTISGTIAGLVLFGVKPRRFLKSAGLRLLVFAGTDKSYSAKLDVLIDGPALGRWQFDQNGNGRTLAGDGLIEQAIAQLRPFIHEQAGEVDESLRRGTTWFYDLAAIRETLINALAHRDWTRFVDIEVAVYSDRLEVISPGALPNGMTIAKMKAGQRSPRNAIIVDTLRDYGYVDARGMGIRTKVVPLTKALSGREPDFEATEDYLKTTLYR